MNYVECGRNVADCEFEHRFCSCRFWECRIISKPPRGVLRYAGIVSERQEKTIVKVLGSLW